MVNQTESRPLRLSSSGSSGCEKKGGSSILRNSFTRKELAGQEEFLGLLINYRTQQSRSIMRFGQTIHAWVLD